MKESLGAVAVGPDLARGTLSGIGFGEETVTAPRVWLCQHCGKRNSGRVLASYNGAPLCLPSRDSDEPNCYRYVSQFNHQMPCEGEPCPGPVPMEHQHEEGEDH